MVNFSALPPAALVRTLVALFLLALRFPAVGQAPAWQSARAVAVATAATGNNSSVTATAVDAAGNVFLAGYFANTVAFGSTTLTSLGSYDIFVAKFNPASNQFVWVQRAGGTGDEYANAIVVSGTSVYVTGSFNSPTAGFGPITLANVSSNSNPDVFIAKLTDGGGTGNFAWAQGAGGTGGYQIALALAVSGTSVYVAGEFYGRTAFGTITLTNMASSGTGDIFVAKLIDAGSTGSFAWAQRAGGSGNDRAYALAVSGANVYVAGGFASSTAGFGAATLTSSGTEDIFVAKLIDAGSTGSFAWAQRAGGSGNDYANSLAVSGANVYVAGGFASSTAGFGVANITSMGSLDAFVAKLTDAGPTSNFVWAQQAGGSGNDGANSLAVSGTSVYMAGSYTSPNASFGPITLFNPNPNAYLGFLATLTDPTLTATTVAGPREPAALFPNPAHHTATLRLPADTAPAPLVLTDALGRAVRRYPAPAGSEAALDLRGLPAGLYLLRGAGPAQRLALE